LQGTFQVSCARACRLAQFSRAAWYRRSRAQDQSALRQRIREFAHARPRFGHLRIWVLLRREGWAVNRKRCVGCIGSTGCSSGCASGGASTSPCTGARPRAPRAPGNAGAWISCMMPWPTVARFGF
jgi:putative transposase